jgi:hypothetical protein
MEIRAFDGLEAKHDQYGRTFWLDHSSHTKTWVKPTSSKNVFSSKINHWQTIRDKHALHSKETEDDCRQLLEAIRVEILAPETPNQPSITPENFFTFETKTIQNIGAAGVRNTGTGFSEGVTSQSGGTGFGVGTQRAGTGFNGGPLATTTTAWTPAFSAAANQGN